MVSWGRAFRGAAGIVSLAIIWWIVGLILVGAGAFISGMGFPPSLPITAPFMRLVTGFVLILLGFLIGLLGSLAAVLKILPEIVAEEIQKK